MEVTVEPNDLVEWLEKGGGKDSTRIILLMMMYFQDEDEPRVLKACREVGEYGLVKGSDGSLSVKSDW